MQRLANAALAVALTTFVSAVSLSLLLAAWLMASHLLNGFSRSQLPQWLFIGLLVLGFNQATMAQPAATGAFAVVEERTMNASGQPIISFTIVTSFDTLPPPVRAEFSLRKKIILPNPNEPDDEFPVVKQQEESTTAAVFYIITARPRSPMYGSGFWLRKYP